VLAWGGGRSRSGFSDLEILELQPAGYPILDAAFEENIAAKAGVQERQTASQPRHSAFRARNRRGMEAQAHFSRGGFDFTVDLSAQKKHQAGDIEPGQQNNHRAKRPVGSKRLRRAVLTHIGDG
jgi:hypothetical protein